MVKKYISKKSAKKIKNLKIQKHKIKKVFQTKRKTQKKCQVYIHPKTKKEYQT